MMFLPLPRRVSMKRGSWFGQVTTVMSCAFAIALVALWPGPRTVAGQRRPQPVSSVRLYVFDCGVLVRGEPTAYNLTREQGGDTNFADPCYLVAHPKGTLLWDVGIIPDAQIKPGGVAITVANGTNKAQTTLGGQLAELGYKPADITYLAVSHGHADHVANANAYAGSTWLAQKAEREAMFNEQARTGAAFPTYSALATSKTIELTG